MDRIEKFKNLIEKSDVGDIEAQNEIHNIFEYLVNVDEKFDDEVFHFCLERDQPYSTFCVSYLYLLGKNVNLDLGKKFLLKSVELKCTMAYILLHSMNSIIEYEGDTDVLFEDAVKRTNTTAMVFKGLNLLENGDKKPGLRLLKRAIKLGSTYAMHKLGEYHHDNGDYSLARKYYLEGIKKDNPGCNFNLAVMYREGEGCERDFHKSINYFEKAKELGDNKAGPSLGAIYYELDDIDTAKKYLKEGITKSDPLSYMLLYKIYKEERKHKKAIKLLIQGSKSQIEMCSRELNKMGIDFMLKMGDSEDDVIDRWLELRNTFHGFGAWDE